MNDVNGKHRSTLTSMLLGRHKGHPFSATTRSARDSQVTLFQAKMCAVCGFCFEGCIHKKTTSALAACVVNVSKRPCRQLWARVARRAWYIFFTLKCALTGVRALSLKVGEKLEQVGTEAGLPVFPSPAWVVMVMNQNYHFELGGCETRPLYTVEGQDGESCSLRPW